MEVHQRRGHQSGNPARIENGTDHQSSQSKDRSEGGMSKQDLLQRMRANKNRQNDQLVSRATGLPSRPQSCQNPNVRPQIGPSPTGRQQNTTSPTGRSQSGPSPTGRQQTGSSPNTRLQSSASPPSRPQSGLSPTGRPQSGPNLGRPQSSASTPDRVRVEVEVHARMTPDQDVVRTVRRRRSTQPQGNKDLGSPEQQNPIAPPRRRYSTNIVAQDNGDVKQQDVPSGESITKPMPRQRRSRSHDRGVSQQKISDAEKQVLLKQYDLLQQQKQQQIEKEKQQRGVRDVQKLKLKQELQLLGEQEQRVVHKLQKFESGVSSEHNVNWVCKQKEMFDRQRDVKMQRKYHEAASRAMIEERHTSQQVQRQRRRRPQPETAQQENHKAASKNPDKAPPVMPKPLSSEEIMAQSVTRQQTRNQNQYSQQRQQQHLHQEQQVHHHKESTRVQQDRVKHHPQHEEPSQYPAHRHAAQGYHVQGYPAQGQSAQEHPTGRKSSPKGSEASHSSSESSEVRLLNYKRRGSFQDTQPSKEPTKPQIKSPVARISQAFRKGVSSQAPQKQPENIPASNLKGLLQQTKRSTSGKDGISSKEMEEIIKRTAERMKLEQKQMREAEIKLNNSEERPRRRRRETRQLEENKTEQTITGNDNRVRNMKPGSRSLDVYNDQHADMTKPADQGRHRVNEAKDNPEAESKTSKHISSDILPGAKNGADESDGVAMVTAESLPDRDTRNKSGGNKELGSDCKMISDDQMSKLSAIEEEITPRSQESIEGGMILSVSNNIQSDSEDKALDEALDILHELASTQINTDNIPHNTKHHNNTNGLASTLHEIETKSQDILANKLHKNKDGDNVSYEESALTQQGIETKSLDNKLTSHNNEIDDGQGSSLHGKPINDSVKVSPKRALATSLPDSVIRNVSGEGTCADKVLAEETQLHRNKQREETQPIIDLAAIATIERSKQREEIQLTKIDPGIGTIEKRHEELAATVSPIPEVTQSDKDGIAIRRKRFVKQVSFHSESGKLQQVIGEADKETSSTDTSPLLINELESPEVQTETSPPDSPKKGILARGRFSGKRDHPSLSKQTGEMYRRPKSALFDIAIRNKSDAKEKGDGVRPRPMSALYISEGDSDPIERGRPLMPKHYRPQSDSLIQLDKFDSLQIKPKPRRERSPSPGLRGFSSPVTQRKLRDRRRTQQRMLPPPSNTLRMPRQPRPGRMAVIVDALKIGLLDSIRTSNEKLEIMKEHQEETKATDKSRQGFHYNLDKQTKAAERFIRKLQFHLAKVEELQELYEKELKVREGAVNMVKAYHDAQSPKAKEPVSEAKVGVRDCTQALCHMEAELEANLGAFVLKIEGIAGFARVTRGDVFEITFKYGFQKWKTKCKVEKDLSQTWEGDEIVLYPMVGDFLTIKVTEIRGLARSNVTIGNLEFDTSDFYGAEPQNLTIDVNETGTIKLNIIVTWSPFQVDEDDLKQLNKNSYHRRERTLTDSMVNVHQKRLSTASTSSSDTSHSPMRPKPKPLEFSSSPTLTLEEALHNVVRLLEILSGQYSELRPLEQQITHLDSFLKKNAEKKRRESTISLSVKNALDSFDFLNEIDEGVSETVEDSDTMEETNRKNALDDGVASDRLSDSTCIEEDLPTQADVRSIRSSPSTNSSVKRSSRFLDLSEKRESRMLELNEQRGNRLLESPSDSSFGSMKRLPGSDENHTTGSESIDVTLTHHLMFTEYLLSHLGAFGPLKLKETIALKKLQQQAVIIEQLIVLAVSGIHVGSSDQVLPELKLNLPLLEFWEQCREKEALYVNADSFLLQLDVKFGAKLRTNHPEIADDVFHSVCNRIIERPADLMSPKTIITLFQYVSFFTQENRRHPEKCLNDITNEFELTASLEPGRPELLRTIKRIPKGFLLPAGNLRALGLLLLEDSATVQGGVRMYLESIAKEDDIRHKAVTVYLECLEERDLSLRQAGCAALAAMQASESFEQLVYLLRCDIDDVKTTAKQALMAFGEEGRLAYEQVSYSPYVAYEHQYTPNGAPLMTTEL